VECLYKQTNSFRDDASFCYCASQIQDIQVSYNKEFVVYDYVEESDLSKGNQNQKRKLGVSLHFSEIIELKFGKKLPNTLCILELCYGCLIISEKCVATHIFFLDSNKKSPRGIRPRRCSPLPPSPPGGYKICYGHSR